MRARSLLTGGALICLGAGALLLGRAVYLDAKAALARVQLPPAPCPGEWNDAIHPAPTPSSAAVI